MAKQAFIALLLIIAIWIAPTHATAPNVKAEAATGRKLVENFQDQKVEELIKLPHKVMVPSEGTCYPPNYDQCDPGCFCIITPTWPWIRPPMPGNCVCPMPPTLETVRKMVWKFQDQTVTEKLIKLPQRVGVPNGGNCLPPTLVCDSPCVCVVDSLTSVYGTCRGRCA